MTTLRSRSGLSVTRPSHGDVLVVRRGGPDPVTVVPDPTGALSELLRASHARDGRRQEEKL